MYTHPMMVETIQRLEGIAEQRAIAAHQRRELARSHRAERSKARTASLFQRLLTATGRRRRIAAETATAAAAGHQQPAGAPTATSTIAPQHQQAGAPTTTPTTATHQRPAATPTATSSTATQHQQAGVPTTTSTSRREPCGSPC